MHHLLLSQRKQCRHATRGSFFNASCSACCRVRTSVSSIAWVSASRPSINLQADTPSDGTEVLTRQQAEHVALQEQSADQCSGIAPRWRRSKWCARPVPASFQASTAMGPAVGSGGGESHSSGALTASRLLTHVGAGIQLSQLVTDFGHTSNLVASSSLQARADEQSAEATREDIVLATDLAFYNALEAQATLQVAQSTVKERQNVGDQVNALTASKLKSTLDQSFAQVNLSQAKLLLLDSQNQADAAMAALADILGSTDEHHYQLVDDSEPPPAVAPSRKRRSAGASAAARSQGSAANP